MQESLVLRQGTKSARDYLDGRGFWGEHVLRVHRGPRDYLVPAGLNRANFMRPNRPALANSVVAGLDKYFQIVLFSG